MRTLLNNILLPMKIKKTAYIDRIELNSNDCGFSKSSLFTYSATTGAH